MTKLTEYLTEYTMNRADQRAPRTIEAEMRYIRLYIAPISGNVPMLLLRKSHIDAVLMPLLSCGHYRTAQAVYTYLRSAAKKSKQLAHALKDVQRPQHRSADINYLTPDEARKLLLFGAERWRCAWLFFLALGLRRGELAGLRWSDIDFDGGYIRICNQRQAVKGKGVIDTPPKSDSGRRILPLLPVIAEQLAPLRAVYEAERLLGCASPYVFTGKSGGGLHPSTIDHALKRDLDLLGLRRITVHGLRHTFAASSVTAGANLRVLSDVLGHAAITTTCKFYAHVDQAPKVAMCENVLGVYAKSPDS